MKTTITLFCTVSMGLLHAVKEDNDSTELVVYGEIFEEDVLNAPEAFSKLWKAGSDATDLFFEDNNFSECLNSTLQDLNKVASILKEGDVLSLQNPNSKFDLVKVVSALNMIKLEFEGLDQNDYSELNPNSKIADENSRFGEEGAKIADAYSFKNAKENLDYLIHYASALLEYQYLFVYRLEQDTLNPSLKNIHDYDSRKMIYETLDKKLTKTLSRYSSLNLFDGKDTVSRTLLARTNEAAESSLELEEYVMTPNQTNLLSKESKEYTIKILDTILESLDSYTSLASRRHMPENKSCKLPKATSRNAKIIENLLNIFKESEDMNSFLSVKDQGSLSRTIKEGTTGIKEDLKEVIQILKTQFEKEEQNSSIGKAAIRFLSSKDLQKAKIKDSKPWSQMLGQINGEAPLTVCVKYEE